VAHFVGTAANDVMAGTNANDRMEGGAGNDRINAGAGDDEIFGGLGSDILTGDAGNDRIFGEEGNDGVYGGGGDDNIDGGIGDDILFGDGGNDTIFGGEGNDRIFGGTGNDIIVGGAGNDILNGDAGDDTFVFRSGDGNDNIIGGQGNDRLDLQLVGGDVTDALLADLAAYRAWSANQLAGAGSQTSLASQTTGASFTFTALGLSIAAIEGLSISVDGREVAIDDLLNAAPVAESKVVVSVDEDGVLEGAIIGSDADGDALSYSLEIGPANGKLELDPVTGRYVYSPAADYSGADSFTVRLTDPSGASVVQVVNVEVGAVADAAKLATSDVVVSLARPIHGTSGNDTVRGDQYPATATVVLDVSAALQDTDGSETLTVQIAGVPNDARLSAGTRNADGVWILTLADLAGLTMTASTARDIELGVVAVTEEHSGASTSVSGTVRVTFDRANNADIFVASTGSDIYDGGAGFDTIDYSAVTSAVTVNLGLSSATGPGRHTLINIEGVVGSSLSDRITGNFLDNVLEGGAGNDTVDGGWGNDTIIGGAGDDRYDGGGGFDTLDYSAATAAVAVDAARGTVTGMGSDRFSGIEKVVGTRFDDRFVGSTGVDTFVGGAGDDWFRGDKGSDVFTGGEGADTFVWQERDIVQGKKSQGVDRITDFAADDVLDLSSVTKGAPASSVIRVTDSAEGSMVAVKVGSSFYNVVLLENVHGATVDSLISDGLLIV
jgi:Ca2+-binding RTX toxin-like protein